MHKAIFTLSSAVSHKNMIWVIVILKEYSVKGNCKEEVKEAQTFRNMECLLLDAVTAAIY